MYQDYPGNFDTSSRGSSGSPAHAESYSSGGGGQQVGAGPGAPGSAGGPLPSSRRHCLFCFLFLFLAKKYLRATVVKFWIFVLSSPTTPF